MNTWARLGSSGPCRTTAWCVDTGGYCETAPWRSTNSGEDRAPIEARSSPAWILPAYSSNCSAMLFRRTESHDQDQDQARVRTSCSRGWPANLGRASLATWNEEGRAQGGRLDEGRGTHDGAAPVVQPRGGALGGVSPAVPKRAGLESIRLDAHPRCRDARHGNAALQRARHSAQWCDRLA